jgi:hypothetical protein
VSPAAPAYAQPVCVIWRQPTLPENRACDLCTHGVDVDGVRHCTRREVVGHRPRPVEQLRAPNGPCGLDAEFLDFPGLHA